MINADNTTNRAPDPKPSGGHKYTCTMATADELVQALANPKDLLVKKFPEAYKLYLSEHPNWDPQWIFRGHSDSTYRLVPSAFRTEDDDKKSDEDLMRLVIKRRRSHNLTMDDRQKAELHLVCAFYRHCNRAGLTLPPLSHHLHKALLDCDEEVLQRPEQGDDIDTWPQIALLPLFGIAQHYGIPTRLLDWTHSPFVAAYFAAESAIEKDPTPTKNLAVWLCATPFIKDTGRETRIQFIELPTAVNPNMSLQQGVFTLLPPEKDMTNELNKRIDILAQKSKESNGRGINYDFPVLLKLELPTIQAPALLKILSTLGYSASRVYHGFRGAADAAKEQFLPKTLSRDNSIELPKDVMDHFETLARNSGQSTKDLIAASLRHSMTK